MEQQQPPAGPQLAPQVGPQPQQRVIQLPVVRGQLQFFLPAGRNNHRPNEVIIQQYAPGQNGVQIVQQHHHHNNHNPEQQQRGLAIRGVNPVNGPPGHGVHQAPLHLQLHNNHNQHQIQQQPHHHQQQQHHHQQHQHNHHNHHHQHNNGPIGDQQLQGQQGDEPDGEGGQMRALHPTKAALEELRLHLINRQASPDPKTWRIPDVDVSNDADFVLQTLLPLDDDQTSSSSSFSIPRSDFIHLVSALAEYARMIKSPYLYAFLTRWGPTCDAIEPKPWSDHLKSATTVACNPLHPHSKHPTFVLNIYNTLLLNRIVFDPTLKITINLHQVLVYLLDHYPRSDECKSLVSRTLSYDFFISQLFASSPFYESLSFLKRGSNATQCQIIKGVLAGKNNFPGGRMMSLDSFQVPFEKEWRFAHFFPRKDTAPFDKGVPPLWSLSLVSFAAAKWMVAQGYELPLFWAYPERPSEVITFPHYIVSSTIPTIPHSDVLETDWAITELDWALDEMVESQSAGIPSYQLANPTSFLLPQAKSLSNCPLELACLAGNIPLIKHLTKRGFRLGGILPLSTFLVHLFCESNSSLSLSPAYDYVLQTASPIINRFWNGISTKAITTSGSLRSSLIILSTKPQTQSMQIEMRFGAAGGAQTTTTSKHRGCEKISTGACNPLIMALYNSQPTIHPSLEALFQLPLNMIELNVIANPSYPSSQAYIKSGRSRDFLPMVENSALEYDEVKRANEKSKLLGKIQSGRVVIIPGQTIPQLLTLFCNNAPVALDMPFGLGMNILGGSKGSDNEEWDVALEFFLDRYCEVLIDDAECEFFDAVGDDDCIFHLNNCAN